jgi:hypothetical protein
MLTSPTRVRQASWTPRAASLLRLALSLALGGCSLFAPSDDQLSGGSPGDKSAAESDADRASSSSSTGAAAGGASASTSGGAGGEQASSTTNSGAGTSGAAGEAAGDEPECNLPRADATLIDDACALVRCHTGFIDENGLPEDGCETPDIPDSRMMVWFAADHGVALDGREAVGWTSKAPNASSADVVSPAHRPTLVGGTSGLPMLEFDGTDEFSLAPLEAIDELSFFAVVEAGEQPQCPSLLHLSNRASSDSEVTYDEIEFGRHEGRLYYESGSYSVSGEASGFQVARRYVVTVTHSLDSTVRLYGNGRLQNVQSIPVPAGVVRYDNFIGNNHWTGVSGCLPFVGRMGELILYGSSLEEAEQRRVETYLAAKWTVSLEP